MILIRGDLHGELLWSYHLTHSKSTMLQWEGSGHNLLKESAWSERQAFKANCSAWGMLSRGSILIGWADRYAARYYFNFPLPITTALAGVTAFIGERRYTLRFEVGEMEYFATSIDSHESMRTLRLTLAKSTSEALGQMPCSRWHLESRRLKSCWNLFQNMQQTGFLSCAAKGIFFLESL